MTSGEAGRYVALAIGGFQLLANGALLVRGFTRLPQELAREGTTTRIADLLRSAWTYGMLGNVCVSVVLLLVAAGLGAGEPLARQIAGAIGVYYVLLGIAAYYSAPTRHPGFFLFSVLGVALVATAWFSGWAQG